MTDVKKLREMAEMATPGPWFQDKYSADGSMEPMPQIHSQTEKIAAATYRSRNHTQHIVDAAYIAAANPQAIIEILDIVDRYKEALITIKGQGVESKHADHSTLMRRLDENFEIAREALEGGK